MKNTLSALKVLRFLLLRFWPLAGSPDQPMPTGGEPLYPDLKTTNGRKPSKKLKLILFFTIYTR